jgi:hypothetical protein
VTRYQSIVNGIVEALTPDDAEFVLRDTEWIALDGQERRAKVVPIRAPNAYVDRWDLNGSLLPVAVSEGHAWHDDSVRPWFFSSTVSLYASDHTTACAYMSGRYWQVLTNRVYVSSFSVPSQFSN